VKYWFRVPLSVPDALHVLQENFLSTAVIEFRGAAVGVAGNPLGYLQSPTVLQVVRDAGRSERVRGIIAHDAGVSQPSLQEISSIKPGHWSGSELPTFAECRREQRRVRLFSQL
jgi:hypothetical protein